MRAATSSFFTVLIFVYNAKSSKCCEDAPTNCSFTDGQPCGWQTKGSTQFINNATRLVGNNDPTGVLHSMEVCGSINSIRCLRFDYISGNSSVNLVVLIYGSNNSAIIMNESYTPVRDFKTVPIEFSSNTSYFITFTVSNHTDKNSDQYVEIDEITFYKSACREGTTTLAPEQSSTDNSAQTPSQTLSVPPTTVVISTTSSPFSISKTTHLLTHLSSTSVVISTTSLPSSISTTTQSLTHLSSTTVKNSNTTTTFSGSSSASTEPLTKDAPNNVGGIVGAVLAIIVLIVAGVVVFIVLKRRRDLYFWKACFKGKTDNSAHTHNVDLPSASVLGRHTTIYSGGGESSADDFDSDADSFDESFSPSGQSAPYANVNKPANRNTTTTGPYEVAELPPTELAPGFEYNHLDLGMKPDKKAGTKSADNYDHIATSKKGIVNTAYSLATNPDGQNSAVASDITYQEPLKATSVYFVIDNEKGNGESTDGQDIYHVPNEEDKTNYAEIEESASVYHEPNEASARTTNSGYYNVDFARGNVPPPQASGSVYNVPRAQINTAEGIYDVPNAPKPPPSTKPAGINQTHKPGTKKPSAPPKPTHPAPAKPQIAQSKPSVTQPKFDAGNSVYHVLHTSSKGETATNGAAAAAASSNYEFAEPITVSGNESIPSSSVYNLASATGNRSHPKELLSSAQSSSNNDDYNSLDLEGNKLSQKSAPAYMEGGIYSHLTDGDKETYNEIDRHKRTEVIDGEYCHLQQL